MLFTVAVITALMVTPAPLRDPLAVHVVQVHPGAAPYADELAERIRAEAHHFGLDVALLAAIAEIESRYHLRQPGEQLASVWQVYPGPLWLRIPRAERLVLQADLVVATWRAAVIVAHHVSRCRGAGPACYCRYNRRPCRRSYIAELYQRARTIRAAIN